jgi:hypothetical protein
MKINISVQNWTRLENFLEKWGVWIVATILMIISILSFVYYYQNGLGLAYNDARSRLDIGRRVVEGLNPGLAQLGSVWLPLTHILMIPLIWNDFMWHSGLAGALWSMISFVAIGVTVYLFLKEIGVGLFERFFAVAIFVANLNILYLQATAMTELVLLATMTAGIYMVLKWFKTQELFYLVMSAFWIMLSTLVRYDGWFLLVSCAGLMFLYLLVKYGWSRMEGNVILFCTLGFFGVFLWLLWNLLIFGDPLYFAFGPYSAHTQQNQLEAAGVLLTKKDLWQSIRVYWYSLAYASGAFTLVLGIIGAIAMWFHKKLSIETRLVGLLLLAPWVFNIIALYLGHSVIFIQGLSGDTWFNVRYGVMMMPSFAILIGYLMYRVGNLKYVLAGMLIFVTFFQFSSMDAVTIDDATVGSSQKNVTEVSGWLAKNATDKPGFILISAASHDSIIFTSGLPMKKFIHEGAGAYYDVAIEYPDRWARWVVVRSNSDDDSTWRLLKDNEGFRERYKLVDSYPFADIYELKAQYLKELNTEAILDPRVRK